MRTASRGFAMVEVVMATAIIAGLTVGALTLVASTAAQKANAANIARGQMLCRTLAEEIATRPVANWSGGTGLSINVDVGVLKITGSGNKPVTLSSGTGNRSTFAVIDNYRNYTETPPKDEDGNLLSGYSGWTRTVKVSPVTLASPATVSANETGLRLVTVTASYGGKNIASTTFLRSSEWERVQP